MALENMTWESVCEAIASVYGTDGQTISDALNNAGVATGDVEQAFKMLEGTSYEIWYNSDGSVRSYNYVGQPDTYLSGNASGVSQIIDSNAQVSTKTAVTVPLNTTTQVADPTKISWKTGLTQTGNFVLKEVLPAIAAANVGITLGKTIDSALYNANPDFWDSNGWGSINPETWASITQDDDSLGAKVFNTVFKIDPQTNTSQAYLDENVLAYLALILQQKGVFAKGDESASYDFPSGYKSFVVQPINLVDINTVTLTNTRYNNVFTYSGNADIKSCIYTFSSTRILSASSDSSAVLQRYLNGAESGTYPLNLQYTYDNKTVYYLEQSTSADVVVPPPNNTCDSSGSVGLAAWIMVYGNISGGATIEGISTQDGATTPSLNDDDTVAEVLAKLKAQYPDLWNDAVTQDVVQPDGSIKTYTYVPVAQAQPNPNPTDGYDPQNQPISSTSTQADPEVDPETATQAQLEYLIGLLTDFANPNLDNTGEGNSPAVVIPTGSASALYTVYNPTESEIHSFGGWLWSSNFVDQLLKMFNDPMQAIISLHKVFCTPSISGRNDIKVGYLNSGVQANVVSNQYKDVDCGSVTLSEYFQNVFDYSPYTEVSLYLPFIGFVRVDVNDIMRATINILYHIDVLTGACLAEVKVTRDMFGGTIYQFTGDCSVHYPLSSGSYMGMVSALLGVAGTIVSGGSLAPMVIGASAKAMSGRSSIERSGTLTGNAGAMGIKKPYFVIQRPQTNLANVFETFVGKPANYTTKISDCTGFISCTEVHIENCNGTDSELAELENLLKTGILI